MCTACSLNLLSSIGFRSGVDHFFFFVLTLIGLSTAGVCVVFSIGAIIGIFTVAQNVYSLFFTFSLVRIVEMYTVATLQLQ